MSTEKRAVVLLAEGFEEIEAVTVIDVLRRAGVEVVAAGVGGNLGIEGAHGIEIQADRRLEDISGVQPDLVVLPGGMPGATNLATDPGVLELVRNAAAAGRLVAAICAGPLGLREAGVLAQRRMTCYPTFADQFPGSRYEKADVVRDANVITGSGPGTALRFALALVEALGLTEQAEELRSGMLAW